MKALLLLLPVFFVLIGCSSIRSKQLVGKEPVDLSIPSESGGLSDIAGEWVNADGEVTSVTVTNAEEGELLYASLDDADEEPVKLKLRMSDDHVFVNFPADEDGERIWFLMKAHEEMNQILLWGPDTDLFRKLIAEGKIKGTNDPKTRKDDEGKEVTVHSPGAVIDDPEGTWVEKMVAGEFGVVFDWKDPTVLRRSMTVGDAATEESGDAADDETGETSSEGEGKDAESQDAPADDGEAGPEADK